MVKVEISHRKSGQVVAVVPVVLRALNYRATEGEAFDLAWQAAVDDQIVKPDKRDGYSFRVLPD